MFYEVHGNRVSIRFAQTWIREFSTSLEAEFFAYCLNRTFANYDMYTETPNSRAKRERIEQGYGIDPFGTVTEPFAALIARYASEWKQVNDARHTLQEAICIPNP